MNASGYVYVADSYGNNRIQAFDPSGTYVTQWGGSGTGNGQFSNPEGITVNASSYVYVNDMAENRIQAFNPSGTYVTKWGATGAGNGQFNNPQGIAVNASGYICVADSNNNRIQYSTPQVNT